MIDPPNALDKKEDKEDFDIFKEINIKKNNIYKGQTVYTEPLTDGHEVNSEVFKVHGNDVRHHYLVQELNEKQNDPDIVLVFPNYDHADDYS